MEQYVNRLELKKTLYQRGLDYALGQLTTLEALQKNQMKTLANINMRSDPDKWIIASNQLVLWNVELVEMVGEVAKYEALIRLLEDTVVPIHTYIGPDPLE